MISIAPMMDCTDRHFRRFIRSITQKTTLYTEMITANAIIYGERHRLLDFSECEHPLVLQLGGADPKALTETAKIVQDWGYDAINLNVGCPSNRVQSGKFGACLMKEPQRVADCVAAMQSVLNIPVTVKTRIGVDYQDNYEFLTEFVNTVQSAGCNTFIFHARKAWLNGLSPKENRDIPPLNYDRVYKLKKDYPHLSIHINGGIKTIDSMIEHLKQVDGVMLGREAYANPYLMAAVDGIFFQVDTPSRSQQEIIFDYLPYVFEQYERGIPLRRLTRFLVGLFQGMPGAKKWRRYLSENMNKESHPKVIEQGLKIFF